MISDSPGDHVVYLDHHATTPIDPRVLNAMMPYLTTHHANPASPHRPGRLAEAALRQARRDVQRALNAPHDSEIIFTSGATESNTLAILGGAHNARPGPARHVVTSAIEHPSVHQACRQLAARGYDVTLVAVDRQGHVRPEKVAAAVRPTTALVSIMYANNEVGTIQDVATIASQVKQHGLLFHVDAVQAAATLPLDVDRLGVDLLSISAHKIYGPKGIGALYVRRGTAMNPQYPGSQEFGLRAGTTNVPGVVGLAEALVIATRNQATEARRLSSLRDRLEGILIAGLPFAQVNGCSRHRLPNTISLTVPGIEAADVVEALPDVAISSGSACSAGNAEPSHVLTAIGLSRADSRATIRIGLGRFTSEAEVDYAARRIVEVASAGER